MPEFFKRRVFSIGIVFAAVISIISVVLAISMNLVEPQAHIAPDYTKVDIIPILSKNELNDSDYKTLYLQTGLGKPAIDEIREIYYDSTRRILRFQFNFFKVIKYVCEKNSPVSREESVVDENGSYIAATDMAPLHNGYILVTKSSHTYGWRNGHSAIVVDAENGLTLESVVLGTNSSVQNIEKWTNFPNFILLRLKNAPAGLMNDIAQSAALYLNDIPYNLTVGVFSSKFTKAGDIAGTHCSHLVWEAFKLFDYDLDSDGGAVVTPKDIANSPYLEVVQVYGVEPENIWP